MRFDSVVLIAAFAIAAHAFVAPHAALSVRVLAHKDECFFEDVPAAGAKVFFHFVVTNGGALDIDSAVYGPDGQLVWSSDKELESRILFKAKLPGPHKFCFSNKMSTVTLKTVMFSVQVGDVQSVTDRSADPVQGALTQISDGLTEIKNEQTYLRARERIQRDNVETTNTRVVLWSLLEIGLIVALAGGQLAYLMSRFEKRRNV